MRKGEEEEGRGGGRVRKEGEERRGRGREGEERM